jgi:hypothetical protein
MTQRGITPNGPSDCSHDCSRPLHRNPGKQSGCPVRVPYRLLIRDDCSTLPLRSPDLVLYDCPPRTPYGGTPDCAVGAPRGAMGSGGVPPSHALSAGGATSRRARSASRVCVLGDCLSARWSHSWRLA